MKKTIILCIAVLVSVSMFAQTAILSQIKDTADCRKWVESQLENMTLKQKIGQLFIHTVEPSLMQRNKANIRKAIEEYGLGGLLFSKGKTEDQVRLTNLAQQWSEVPLLITFDGEWGLAMRLKDTPDFPKNRILGCIENDSLIYLYGREVARQLREIGVQVNFAPVADVDNNPANPVINVRSFGSGPKEVARKVIAYARGLEDGGVLAVCKHFPGHGDTETDSHQALPVLNFDRARLDSVELYPFRKAVEAGIGGMMVGHLQVSEIEDKPASVSPGIITSVLRNELRFSGLVFTDALEMKGIRRIIAGDHVEGIAVLNRYPLQPRAELLRELILRIAQLLGHRSGEVIPKRAVHHRSERHFAERPYRPGTLDGREKLRVAVDMPCMGVDIPAVQRLVDLLLQLLHLGRTFGEKHGSASAERFGVDAVRRDQRQNMLEHRLLPAIVGNRCSHGCISAFIGYICASHLQKNDNPQTRVYPRPCGLSRS